MYNAEQAIRLKNAARLNEFKEFGENKEVREFAAKKLDQMNIGPHEYESVSTNFFNDPDEN